MLSGRGGERGHVDGYRRKKGSDKKYIRMLMRYGARGDVKNAKGITAAEIMSRKRDPEFRKMAEEF